MGPSGASNDRATQVRTNWSDPINSNLRLIGMRLRGSLLNRGLLLGLTLVVMNTFIVAHMQPPTAFALLRYTPPLALLTSTLLNLGPIVAQIWVVYATVSAAAAVARDDWTRGVTKLLAAVLVAGASGFLVDQEVVPSERSFATFAAVAVVGALVCRKVEGRQRAHEEGFAAALLAGFLIILAVWPCGAPKETSEASRRTWNGPTS